jgi:hypothetical protein
MNNEMFREKRQQKVLRYRQEIRTKHKTCFSSYFPAKLNKKEYIYEKISNRK